MKGATNGVYIGKGVMEYTELEPTVANMGAIGTNQQGMLIFDNFPYSSSSKISGIVYFKGPITAASSTGAWGTIGSGGSAIHTVKIESTNLMVTGTTSSGGNYNRFFSLANLPTGARLYVADLPGGGAVELLNVCSIPSCEVVA